MTKSTFYHHLGVCAGCVSGGRTVPVPPAHTSRWAPLFAKTAFECQLGAGPHFKPHEAFLIHSLQQPTEAGAIVTYLRDADSHAQGSTIQPSPKPISLRLPSTGALRL